MTTWMKRLLSISALVFVDRCRAFIISNYIVFGFGLSVFRTPQLLSGWLWLRWMLRQRGARLGTPIDNLFGFKGWSGWLGTMLLWMRRDISFALPVLTLSCEPSKRLPKPRNEQKIDAGLQSCATRKHLWDFDLASYSKLGDIASPNLYEGRGGPWQLPKLATPLVILWAPVFR